MQIHNFFFKCDMDPPYNVHLTQNSVQSSGFLHQKTDVVTTKGDAVNSLYINILWSLPFFLPLIHAVYALFCPPLSPSLFTSPFLLSPVSYLFIVSHLRSLSVHLSSCPSSPVFHVPLCPYTGMWWFSGSATDFRGPGFVSGIHNLPGLLQDIFCNTVKSQGKGGDLHLRPKKYNNLATGQWTVKENNDLNVSQNI